MTDIEIVYNPGYKCIGCNKLFHPISVNRTNSQFFIKTNEDGTIKIPIEKATFITCLSCNKMQAIPYFESLKKYVEINKYDIALSILDLKWCEEYMYSLNKEELIYTWESKYKI